MQTVNEYPSETTQREDGVTVAFPATAEDRGPYESIVGRGNLPLLIEDCLLAEVSKAQLENEWQACGRISDAEAADFCRRAANRLSRAFDAGIAAADLSDIVANAAVLFVLSLRQSGVRSPSEIAPCTVQYDASSGKGNVVAAA